ncbi:MAG: DUF1569 domain-containing protein [Flavobacteriaceae bacterium]
MKNIFDKTVCNEVISRINNLNSKSNPVWGTMTVAQMLAHTNIQYEVIYESDKFPKPNALTRFMLKTFVKETVVGPKPFKRNGRTAPYFIINDSKDFEQEKKRLIDYIILTQKNGVEVLIPRDTKSFGKLSAEQWNNLFYKHIDHHLAQFDV